MPRFRGSSELNSMWGKKTQLFVTTPFRHTTNKTYRAKHMRCGIIVFGTCVMWKVKKETRVRIGCCERLVCGK